ncbi:hypothetical protein IKE79_01300, partial [Candidatus Saccharibacteria bacterium]|nr:hypothetical protein [Candidatus Saccharibacteria bacterium]
ELPVNSYNYAIDPTSNPNDANYSNSTATVTFAAKVDKTQAAGEYKADLTFKATANVVASNCSSKTICYNDNGASSTTTMANQTTADDGTTIETNDTVTLWASNYQRANYGFLGWMTTPSPEADTKYYGPNETITADGTLEGSGITLYANWLPKSTRYTMQTFTSAVCKNELTPVTYNATTGKTIVSPNSFMALEDERDGNVYAVARLGMGWDSTNNTYASTACWMIENLRLSSKQLNGSTNVAINANNTNNPADNFVSLNVNNETWCVNGGEGCVNTNQVNTINTIYTGNNSTGTVSEMSNHNQNVYSYGNYYNWYSTTAGDGTWSIAANNTSADGDICPINWRLPRGGGIPNSEYVGDVYPYGDNAVGSDFYALGQYLSSNGFLHNNANDNSYYLMSNFGVYPFNFVLSGYYLDATTAKRGFIGRYWSSTAVSEADAYYAEIYVNYVGPGTYRNGKVVGFAVRCMAGV